MDQEESNSMEDDVLSENTASYTEVCPLTLHQIKILTGNDCFYARMIGNYILE